MSDSDLWFLPGPADDEEPAQARQSGLTRANAWQQAQSELAVSLAGAAQALGALDAVLANDPGMIRRLAMMEVEAMLWAEGTPLPREEIGRDLMAGRASSDPQVMAKARWALRRLEGQADPSELRGFLGLHRVDDPAEVGRVAGDGFDAAAREIHSALETPGLHPLTRGAMAAALWPLGGLSPVDDVAELACFAARIAASGLDTLTFAPLGQPGRRVWRAGGTVTERLSAWLDALRGGAAHARAEAIRLDEWAERAVTTTARMKGDTPARVIRALRATPLMTTEMVEQDIGASRDTAERVLARLLDMGLIREITGTRRFRLWSAP